MLIECPSRDQDGFFRLSELQVHVIGLPGADVVRLLPVELEIRLEFPFPDFGVDLPDDGMESLVLSFKQCFEALCDTVDIVLVYPGFNLVARQVVYLAYLCSGCYGLPENSVQQPEFPVNRGLYGQVAISFSS